MKRWKAVTLAATALLALAAFAVIASGVLPYRLYIVHTGSMSPTITSRSAVLVRTGEYRVGQVITFTVADEVITHRLKSIDSAGRMTTKGDGNGTDDPWTLTKNDIIGGVIASPPDLGYWLMYLKNPLGLLSILVGAFVFWQLWSLGNGVGEARHRARRKRRHTASSLG
ncbi:signal peptidase I [Lacisediminihabitans changchengi]|uniref:Signal peptidase I n=1 Tax=Lacisediminihabitans changchengi TaxID=2787634 RepID=A0A934W4H5_9MICO|nr:signal peptidase I [Lacisediminihabitans changchengi]MBK4348976.1 signal peptidase I [Lacisediminihabitans changchengi]